MNDPEILCPDALPLIGGRYRHYKGNEYTVLAVGRHSEDLSPQVIYRAEYGAHEIWVRPLSMFLESVEKDGKVRRRFACLSGELFRPAVTPETDAVAELYRSCVGLPGCTWDDSYPTREMAVQDIAAGDLFVLYDGEMLIGTVSLIDHDDLDGLPVWSESVKPAVLVRPGVTPVLQHRGWGTKLLAYALKAAWERGADSVRLLCGTENTVAFSMYRRADFEVRGEAEMYGRRYFCMERLKRSGE